MVQRAVVRGTVRVMKCCINAVLRERVFMNMETRGQDWKRVRKLLKKSVPSGTFQRPKMHSLDASF